MAKIIVAFDNPTVDELKKVHDEIGSTGVIYKFGLEFAEAQGPQGITAIGIPEDQIFLDHKWFDISNTVLGATRSALKHHFPLLINVASQAGRGSMLACVEGSIDAREKTKVIAVTALTSWTDEECVEITGRTCDAYTRDISLIANEVGCDGVVCHTRSVPWIRDRIGQDFLIVTPGIRFPEDAANDQYNPAHPTAAAKAGSNFLVVGRPILKPTSGTRYDAAMRFVEAATI